MADSRKSGTDEADGTAFTLVAPETPGPFVFASPPSGDL